MKRPLLLIDVDGVISLFGFEPSRPPAGRFLTVDGIPHLLSATAGEHLRRLCRAFEPAWCTGWEEKANEYLPHALELPGPFPHLSFEGAAAQVAGHWKLHAIDRYAGRDRPLAWVDDAHDERCESWAAARPAPTLLVGTDPAIGLADEQVERLLTWAGELAATGGFDRPAGRPRPA
jgi:hypothetical protein